MGASQQPYLYDLDQTDTRFPTKAFDPKAATRASWEPKPKKAKHDGPLISFNRHPDLHEVPTGRTSKYQPMSSTTKGWIKWTRRVQLGLRCLELVGALGLLVLMILISNVDALTAWIMRIAPGVVAINSVYGIWHLSRPAGGRTPTSSAAYQLFAAFTDLAVLPFYAFGALQLVHHRSEWTTLLSAQSITENYLVPAEYYTLIGAGGLHVVSLGISLWLGLIFRRIANMPPDMNPLEAHLTARHKRNKSSVSTSYTAMSESSKRLSTPLEERRRSGAPYETLSRPPSIPFMHTRSGSRDSVVSSKHDLPSRQYQIQPDNSPRSSVASAAELKRLSKPASKRGNYTEIPLHETGMSPSRPGSLNEIANASPTRAAKFTEAWYTSESLINRTQQRQRAMNAANASASASKTRAYEAVNQQYDVSDDDSDQENDMRPDPADVSDLDSSIMGTSMHPNPLRSNPTPSSSTLSSTPPSVPPHVGARLPRAKTPYYSPRGSALSEVSLNSRSVSGSQDITDQMSGRLVAAAGSAMDKSRNSSIQGDDGFYSKPYGELKAATPPIVVGFGRQVSSGNDYDLGGGYGKYRRNVSGKIAEEGMAGNRYSRYSVLNDD
ncbi:hypothetical protein BJ170DRAFT_592311 [Xylariales sp. AK1849]|nr:hypothetical protein BJ170DRAFT_592311 [Xylariales sp. AK1849]